MHISKLEQGQKNISVEGEIIDVLDVKTFPRMGDPGRVAISKLKDDTGVVDLTLWDEEIDLVKKGVSIKLEDGSVKEYNGKLQVTSGRKGKISLVE